MPAANYNAAVLANGAAGENVMLLTARWDETTPAPACGQFYMLRAWEAEEAPLLSRPISVHRFDREKKEISFLYEVRGTGTQKLAALRPGDTVALTGPSGRGFPVDGTLGGAVALVGGGIGTAPLLQLAAELAAQGVDVDLYAGFRDEPYRVDAFSAACRSVHIATDSGRQIFVCGHMEYDRDTLRLEYERDVKRGLPIAVPENYFEDDDPAKGVVFRWRSHANLFFSNWLNYYVYQETPYDLEKL